MNIFKQSIRLFKQTQGQFRNSAPSQFIRQVQGCTFQPEAADPVGNNLQNETHPEIRQEQKKRIRKMLRTSSTFDEIPAEEERLRDPFMSGPYVQGTQMPKEVKDEIRDESIEKAPKIDPKTKTVITFPGDGTQILGMSGDPSRLPGHIKVLYDMASQILGYDLLDLIVSGPRAKLDRTRYSQPAIFVASLAALENLRDRDPQAVENCISTAGFGLGEVAALVLAGSLTYEDAISFVKYRAESMQLAGEITPSGMAVVMYGADSKLGPAMTYAEEWCRREYHIENPVCSTAHYLFPHCKVIGGNTQALDFIQLNYKDFKLRKVKRLPAAAAYNTMLMRQAAEPLKAFLDNITITDPRIKVYCGLTGNRYFNAKQIKMSLAKEVYQAVKWEQILHSVFSRPQSLDFPVTYECGPGRSLGPIFKLVNRKAYQHFYTVGPDDIVAPQ